uniref:Uncharacterized protein n=1 Tax=viral metagenome TaxID=1070528 RepID=A0A6M3XG45_9ZZZZ
MSKITNFEEVIVWGFLGAILLFVLKIYFLGAILSAFVSGIMFSEYALKSKKLRVSSHKTWKP